MRNEKKKFFFFSKNYIFCEHLFLSWAKQIKKWILEIYCEHKILSHIKKQARDNLWWCFKGAIWLWHSSTTLQVLLAFVFNARTQLSVRMYVQKDDLLFFVRVSLNTPSAGLFALELISPAWFSGAV